MSNWKAVSSLLYISFWIGTPRINFLISDFCNEMLFKRFIDPTVNNLAIFIVIEQFCFSMNLVIFFYSFRSIVYVFTLKSCFWILTYLNHPIADPPVFFADIYKQ